jgi:hypothetical protein
VSPPRRDRTDDGFYLLSDPVSNPPFRGRMLATSDEGWAFGRAEASPDSPVRVEWAMGAATPSDVVWKTSVGLPVVSRRVIQLLESGGFTGWDTYPVDLVDKAGDWIPGYAGLMVTGRCDPVDLSRSEVVVRQFPGGWFPNFRGHFFPRESWDGSDLFVERKDGRGSGSGALHATARLIRALRRHRIKNLRIQHTSEVEVSVSVYAIGEASWLPPDLEARLADAYARRGVPRPVTV